jgi:serine/threonine protein kinase
MEYVPGGSVANIVQAFGAMSEEIVRSFTLQILHGLVYLHSHDVIHRDLKPGLNPKHSTLEAKLA